MPGQKSGWRGNKKGYTLMILKALFEIGPQSCADLCIYLELTRDQVQPLTQQLRKATPRAGKRIYVKEWVYDADGQLKKHPRPVFALGNQPDKPRPRPRNQNDRMREVRARRKHRLLNNFVFNLGNTCHDKL